MNMNMKLLFAAETITENHKGSKCRVVKLSPDEYIYKTNPHLGLGRLRKMGQGCKIQRGSFM